MVTFPFLLDAIHFDPISEFQAGIHHGILFFVLGEEIGESLQIEDVSPFFSLKKGAIMRQMPSHGILIIRIPEGVIRIGFHQVDQPEILIDG